MLAYQVCKPANSLVTITIQKQCDPFLNISPFTWWWHTCQILLHKTVYFILITQFLVTWHWRSKQTLPILPFLTNTKALPICKCSVIKPSIKARPVPICDRLHNPKLFCLQKVFWTLKIIRQITEDLILKVWWLVGLLATQVQWNLKSLLRVMEQEDSRIGYSVHNIDCF